MTGSVGWSWFVLLVALAYTGSSSSEAPDLQKTLYWCVDMDCKDPISEGRTTLTYPSPSKDQLSFGKNQEVTILSKPVDNTKGHWIGMIRGKVGMIPVNLVKETRTMGKLEHGYKYPLDVHPLQPKEKSSQKTESTNNPEELATKGTEPKESLKTEVFDGTPILPSDTALPMTSSEEIPLPEGGLEVSESVAQVLLQPSQSVDLKLAGIDDAESQSEETSHLLSSQPITPVLTDNPSVVFTSEKTDLSLDEDSSAKSTVPIEATPPVPASKETTEETEAPEVNLHPSPAPFSVFDSIQTLFGGNSDSEKEEPEVTEKPQSSDETIDADKDNRVDGVADPEEAEMQAESPSTNPVLIDEENKSPEPAPVETENQKDSSEELTPTEQATEEPEVVDVRQHEHTNPILSGHSHSDSHHHELGDHQGHEGVKPDENELQSFATENLVQVPLDAAKEIPPIQSDTENVKPDELNHHEQQDPLLHPHSEEHGHEHPEKLDSAENIPPTDQVTEEPKVDAGQHEHLNPFVSGHSHSHPEDHHHEHGDHHHHHHPTEDVPVSNDSTKELPLNSSDTDEPKGENLLNPQLHTHSEQDHDHLQSLNSAEKLFPADPVTEEPKVDGRGQHEHLNPLLSGHSHAKEEQGDQHDHNNDVKPEENEVPSFATEEDSVQGPIDATEEIPPIYPDPKKPKVDLVGRHRHLNPLLHPHPQHDHEHEHSHLHEHKTTEGSSSFVIALQHLSSTLVNFLPEYLQDTILDVNDALVFTGIIALTLISICVPYFFIETFLSVRPLKKKVTELNKNLWKVSTAYENQQEEYEMFKKKALAYDEDKKRIDELESKLQMVKELEAKQKVQIRQHQKELVSTDREAKKVEKLVSSTMEERNKAVEERDKLKIVVVSLQTSLKETSEELEAIQSEAATTQMDLELINHTKDNLELKVKAVEKEMLELKQKVLAEVELRRSLQLEKDQIGDEKDSLQEELTDLKGILHKYEETVSDLNQELSLKENELSALKETLGDDSPLIDIAEMTARLQVAESQAKSLQSRVESITLENTSLNRNYEQTKNSLKTLQVEKDQAETRLQVLESYFKEKEEELRTIVEKYEVEKNIRGKDKDELALMIEEKIDEVKDLSSRLEKLKEEFEQTKLAHRNEIRALEAKSHENWLSLCQSERKAQDVRKESELLRQKLTAIAKGKEAEPNDARSSNGDALSPFMFSQLELEEVPLPIMPDESTLPSYFGLGEDFYGLGDFEPPAPLDDDEEDGDDTLNSRQGREREPQRPPPLGRLSPTFSDNEPDMSPIIIPRGGREDYSDGSSSPLHNRPTSRGNWMNGNQNQSTPTRRRGPQTSSPIQHGLNL